MSIMELNLSPELANRICMGAVALILAGVIGAPFGLLTRNVPTNPERNPEFAAGANSMAWRAGLAANVVAIALTILGFIALYVVLSRSGRESLAFWGLVVGVGFMTLFLPMVGFAAYTVPAIGVMQANGQPEMVAVMDQVFKEPFVVIPFLSGILMNLGPILLGIAMLRVGGAWRWAGALFILNGVIGVPSFLDVKAFQIVGPLLTGIAQMVVGVLLWRVTGT